MANRLDYTTIEVPVMLKELMERERLHPRQALHEIVEEAFFFWKDQGGWLGFEVPPRGGWR